MSDYQKILADEIKYLDETLDFIDQEIESEMQKLNSKKAELIAMKREMMEDTGGVSGYQGLAENSQYLTEVNSSTAIYNHIIKQIEKYRELIDSPYFGRVDFIEQGEDNPEKLYIGLSTVIDSKSNTILIYDWRAPISSIYYRYGRGEAQYDSPMGKRKGIIELKRQYKIKDSKLVYFFDCNVSFDDPLLQDMLSQNKSGKMKNIVETIQKEQDSIIRDTENNLLIVQGVAGSGKTSVALHRIAYLLYNGRNHLRSNNVIIISPNNIFSDYISNILPELGEENVTQATFYELACNEFKDRFEIEEKETQLEFLINSRGTSHGENRRKSVGFKGSAVFVTILNRMLDYYTRHLIEFSDIYYDGQIVMNRQQLKNRFLNNKFNIPMSKQLQRLRRTVLDKIQPLQYRRYNKIFDIVERSEGRDLESESYSRLLTIKYSSSVFHLINSFTQVDYWNLYKSLFSIPGLFKKLSGKLKLPDNIDRIIDSTGISINRGYLHYEDIGPMLYLKLKIEGESNYAGVRQAVIDEAQDYYPIDYEVFNLMFKESNYTLLGDINQAVEKDPDYSFYDEVASILAKKKTAKLFIETSYRSSYEISKFTQRIIGKKHLSYQRHGQEPQVFKKNSEEKVIESTIDDITFLKDEGYRSIAVICKSQAESERAYLLLKPRIAEVELVQPHKAKQAKIMVIPAYVAKGLEFDAVIIFNASKENYNDEYDKKLLYVACTRALHSLNIYYTGEKTPFIN